MKNNFIKNCKKIALSTLCLISISACAGASDTNTNSEDTFTSNTNYSAYLKIDRIEGDCKDRNHDKWIDVIFFSHGSLLSIEQDNPSDSGTGTFEPFVMIHKVDKATPKIQEACMKGTSIKTVELHVTTYVAGMQEVIYKAKAEEVKVTKAEVRMGLTETSSTGLVEEVTFLANKFTWTSITVGLDDRTGGIVEANYDQTKKA